jgi:arsenite methyltransferase
LASIESGVTTAGKPGYGIDEPLIILGLVAAGSLCGLGGALLDSYLAGQSVAEARTALVLGALLGVFFMALGVSLLWYSFTGRFSDAKKLVRNVPLGGNELILDVGCARGVLSVAFSARQTGPGVVVGLDTWGRWHTTSNSPRSLMVNARVHAVGKRIIPVMGHPCNIPFDDKTFDVVSSSMGLSRLGGAKEFDEAVSQMVRVTKEGGRLAILSSGYSWTLPRLLSKLGLVDVKISRFRRRLFPVTELTIARKPFPADLPASGSSP